MSGSANILICDHHAGCQAAIWHTLRNIGIEADILSLSRHAHLLQSLGVPEKCILKSPKLWKKAAGLPFIGRLATLGLRQYDLAICAFPPPFYRELLLSKIAKQVLLVAGHRIDLGIKTQSKRTKYFAQLKHDITAGQVHVAALNEYDAAYFRNEVGFTIETLGCSRKDLLKIVNQARPDTRVGPTLIGPSHVTETSIYHDLKNHFLNTAPSATPKSIRSLYERYTYQQLATHSCCVTLPYSIFSISIDELFALGLRVLIPSDRLLNQYNLLNDVKLWPIYTSRENATQFSQSASPNSPNTIIDGITPEWLSHASWNERAGTERWDSFEELQSKLNEDASPRVSRNIESENKRADHISQLWSIKIDHITTTPKN